MNKALLIPDSFKGTLSSREICELIAAQIAQQFPECEIVSIPVADGGEGSIECFLSALGGEKITATVSDPFFQPLETYYGLIAKSQLSKSPTAIVEMASCAGLPLVENHKDPKATTTYGVGELMVCAAHHGAQTIIVGLGGSCTTDGGCGAAAAAGIKFYDARGNTFVPTGGTLTDIARIDTSGLDPVLSQTTILAMCDIDNPMYGPTGAAYVFAPQKGADDSTVSELDRGLAHLAALIKRDLNIEVANVAGSGAAGAMGAGMMAFFNAKLQMGIETVLDTVDFFTLAQDTDVIFTGEGKLDGQSLRGKVVIGVAKRAQALGIPVIALVGGAEDAVEKAYEMGVTAVFPINRLPEDFEVSRYKSAENLSRTVQDILRLIAAFQ